MSATPTEPPAEKLVDRFSRGIRETEEFNEVHARAISSPSGERRLVSLHELHESPWNPRQHFPEEAMQELVESMKAGGFREWLPLMVRPRAEGGYEIGAGHRRRRAAELAGILEVPCIIRALSDEEFLDVLNFDNSGREDVHPMHEAAGWQHWLEKTGKTVLDIAAKIGRSREYVYQRLKYAALIPAGQKAFLNGEISARHAVLIARLQPPDQKQALDASLNGWAKSSRELERWIEQHIHHSLKGACFDPKDAGLLPGVPACIACPKRAGNSPELFSDIQGKDTCTDPTCYHRKEDAHIQIQIEKRNVDPDAKKTPLLKISTRYMAYGEKPTPGILGREAYYVIEKKTDRCDLAKDAIVAEGEKGKEVLVCTDKSCRKHWAKGGKKQSEYGPSPQEIAARKKREAEERLKELARREARKEIAARVAVPLDRAGLLLIAHSVVVRYWHDHLRKIFTAYELKPDKKEHSTDFVSPMLRYLDSLSDEDLARKLIDLMLWQDSEGQTDAEKQYGVDVDAIRKRLAEEREEPKGKKVKAETPAEEPKTAVSRLATLAEEQQKKRVPAKKKPTPKKKSASKKAPAAKKAAKPKGKKAGKGK